MILFTRSALMRTVSCENRKSTNQIMWDKKNCNSEEEEGETCTFAEAGVKLSEEQRLP